MLVFLVAPPHYFFPKGLDIGPGDEVITTSMTFCSTVNIILHCGATPVLCDVDPVSKNILIDDIERKITSKTKAIIPVHYCGYPCDMTSIKELADRNNLCIVEDCAHAIEAMHKGTMCGAIGDIGCFSFYATKNIAIGEGGMAISNREVLINKMATLGLHGMSRDAWKRFAESQRSSYDVIDIGYKMNLTDLQSAIGLIQLERIDEMYTRRKELWEFYNNNLIDLNVELPTLPSPASGDIHALHLYTIGLPSNVDRDQFVWECKQSHGVTMGVHYNSINTFSIYRKMNLFDDPLIAYPVAFAWGKRTVSLSLSAAVSNDDAERVVNSVKLTLNKLTQS